MKKFIAFGLLILSVNAWAIQPSKLNICSAWLSTYSQFHDNNAVSILSSEFDAEMKRLNLYSTDQIENALDQPVMLLATDNGEATDNQLSYCVTMARNFTGDKQ